MADERRGDLLAQLAALRRGAARLQELVHEAGPGPTRAAMAALQDYSARLMSATLRRLRSGTYRGRDWMDDDGAGATRIPIRVAVRIGRGRAQVDFTGTAAQVAGGINANYAVTVAAVLYVFQALADAPIPANAGLMRPLRIIAPLGTLVNARFPAAVAGGNVETSQRIVDALLKALAPAAPERIPAASNGSMNNLALGGFDPLRQREFAYYETIAGGAGAGPHGPGRLGRAHAHDQHPEHAGGSLGSGVPATGDPLRLACRLRGQGPASRRRRRRARDRIVGARACDPVDGAAASAALWVARRRSRSQRAQSADSKRKRHDDLPGKLSCHAAGRRPACAFSRPAVAAGGEPADADSPPAALIRAGW